MRHPPGQVSFVGSFPGNLPRIALPEIAFAGRSNVGKSSLLNVLMNRRGLARTSRTPGRTQAVNLFRLDDAVVFADLPGYGYAKVPEAIRAAWKPMVEGYLATREDLRLVLVLLDIRREPGHDEGSLLWGLTEARIPHCVVATKADKLGKQQRQRQLAKIRRALHLPAGRPLPFSALSAEGRDAVWDVISEAVRAPPRELDEALEE